MNITVVRFQFEYHTMAEEIAWQIDYFKEMWLLICHSFEQKSKHAQHEIERPLF